MSVNASTINSTRVFSLFKNTILLFIPFSAVYILYLLLFWADAGLDITDESYYLLSATQADNISFATTQFGHYVGILLSWVNNDVVLLRQLGITILIVLSFLLSVQLQRYWELTQSEKINGYTAFIIHLTISLSAMNYYGQWMLTPSYNWLTLVSIILAAFALLGSVTHKAQWPYFVLLGFAGALTFLAKPPSAIILAVIAIIWFTLHRTYYINSRYFSISILVAFLFLLFHAYIFNTGIINTWNEIENGQTAGALMTAGSSTVLSIVTKLYNDMLSVPERTLQSSAILFYLLFPVIWITSLKTVDTKIKTFGLTFFSLVLIASIWMNLFDLNLWKVLKAGYAYVIFTASIFVVLLGYGVSTSPSSSHKDTVILKILPLLLLLVASGIAFAFGSGRTTFQQISLAALFLVAASVYMALALDKLSQLQVFTTTILLLSQVSLVLIIIYGFYNPYRINGSVEEQTDIVYLPNLRGSLKVEPKTATYIQKIQTSANNANWQPNTLLIDLTGGSPVANLLLDAKVPATPWLLGGYPGSSEMAQFVLSQTPDEDLRNAWVLTSPNGRRRLGNNMAILTLIDFPTSYIQVGNFVSGHRNEHQILWKPKNVSP